MTPRLSLSPWVRRWAFAIGFPLVIGCSEPAAASVASGDANAALPAAVPMTFDQFARPRLRSFFVGSEEFSLLLGYRESTGEQVLALVPVAYYNEVSHWYEERAKECPGTVDPPQLRRYDVVNAQRKKYDVYVPAPSIDCGAYPTAVLKLQNELTKNKYADIGEAYEKWKVDGSVVTSEGYLTPGDPYTVLTYDLLVQARQDNMVTCMNTSSIGVWADGGLERRRVRQTIDDALRETNALRSSAAACGVGGMTVAVLLGIASAPVSGPIFAGCLALGGVSRLLWHASTFRAESNSLPARSGKSLLFLPVGNLQTGGLVRVRVFAMGDALEIDGVVPGADYDSAFQEACDKYDAYQQSLQDSVLEQPGARAASIDPRTCPEVYTPNKQKTRVSAGSRQDVYVYADEQTAASLVVRFRGFEKEQTIEIQRPSENESSSAAP